MAAANLEHVGVVPWGKPLPCTDPGVYVVSLDQDPTSMTGAQSTAPLSSAALEDLLSRRPEMTVDGRRPTREELAERLGGFWLCDEVVLYIGLAGRSLAGRVDDYYKTPLGARSPHAGGWFLKTLTPSPPRWVHWARASHPAVSEDLMLEVFCAGASETARSRLLDPDHPFPFANLEWPPGVRKRHGVAGAKSPRAARRVASAAQADEGRSRFLGSGEGAPLRSSGAGLTGRGGLTSPLRSQRMTAADRDAGQVRIPSGSKRVFPQQAAVVAVVLRGRQVEARWNPRIGPDRERSGTLRLGRQALTDLVPVETILVVTRLDDGTIELA